MSTTKATIYLQTSTDYFTTKCAYVAARIKDILTQGKREL
jgi:hypothetical protein